MKNRPSQLTRINKESQDKLYKKQPQLLERLIPLINRAGLFTPQKKVYGSKINEIKVVPFTKNKRKRYTEMILIKKVNVQRNNFKMQKKNRTNIKKISDIPFEVLWGLK